MMEAPETKPLDRANAVNLAASAPPYVNLATGTVEYCVSGTDITGKLREQLQTVPPKAIGVKLFDTPSANVVMFGLETVERGMNDDVAAVHYMRNNVIVSIFLQ